jgi:hypothetical protein
LLDDPADNNKNELLGGPSPNNLITKETNLMDDLLSMQFNPSGTNTNQNKSNPFGGMGQKIMSPTMGNNQIQQPINKPMQNQTPTQ